MSGGRDKIKLSFDRLRANGLLNDLAGRGIYFSLPDDNNKKRWRRAY